MFGGKRYNVQVTTGKAKGAGTNATVKIVLIDHEGKNLKRRFSINGCIMILNMERWIRTQ